MFKFIPFHFVEIKRSYHSAMCFTRSRMKRETGFLHQVNIENQWPTTYFKVEFYYKTSDLVTRSPSTVYA